MQLAIRGIAVTIADTEVARIVDDHFSNPFAREHGIKAHDAPRIGEQYFDGGIYAGLTLHNNTPMHLVLLNTEGDGLTWGAAKTFAEDTGGELPSRFDALVLFTNLRDKFQKTYYWTAAPNEPGYAWFQNFRYGDQLWDDVSSKLRARAVRRLPI